MSRIVLIEPFFTGSHKRWAEEISSHSRHEIHLVTLPGVHWKWRMHGAAVTLASQINQSSSPCEALLVTDMLDLAVFKGLLHESKRALPCAVYFHENQLVYPWSSTDPDVRLRRDRHYGWINYTSALAADKVIFNSRYHLVSFVEGVRSFLNDFPDHTQPEMADLIQSKSEVLYPGIDLSSVQQSKTSRDIGAPIIVWNHRWEYDKNPDLFFNTLYQLSDLGLNFRLVVLGESFPASPSIFKQAKERLAHHVLHWGYCEDRATYWKWLWRSHIMPVTARQDFFGYSVVEGLTCGLTPILPRRLAYPEHSHSEAHFYTEESDFALQLEQAIRSASAQQEHFEADRYDWNTLTPKYDHLLSSLISA